MFSLARFENIINIILNTTYQQCKHILYCSCPDDCDDVNYTQVNSEN